MTENQGNDHNGQASLSSENNQVNEDGKIDRDIIELSDIAIGITPEDDAIVELTEEIIGEAFFGFSKATHETMDADESHLDLSEEKQSDGITEPQPDRYKGEAGSPSVDIPRPIGSEADANEDDISRELDNYFGTEDDIRANEILAAADPLVDETPSSSAPLPLTGSSELPPLREMRQIGETTITPDQLDEAIERVIRKLYAEKINRILDAMIERTVTEEISQLKDYLIGIAEKKD